MIVRKKDRVVVLGITGKQGTFWTEKMIGYGTNVVAGINPKCAGETHVGVPIFASTADAVRTVGGDVAVGFIPPPMAKEAAVSAAQAGIKLLVVLTEHIPAQDVMAIHAAASKHGTRVVGPNTAGLVTPGECFVGIMPAFVPSVFKPGRVGVISRSGSLGTLVCLNLTRAGLGQSAFIGIGGDPMLGSTTRDALEAFDADAGTDAIVIVGEIGGGMEEAAAEYAKGVGKPMVFSSVPAEAHAQTRQLRGVLHGLGATSATPATILSDGAVGPRSLGEAASPGPTHHVLDWFHLAMRIQHPAQAAKSWPGKTEDDRQAGKRLAETIERIRWRLWHGQVRRSLDLIEETAARLEAMAEDTASVAAAQKVARLLRDLETYVSGQSEIIIDYATARRCGEPISTAITESTVQWLLHRRMNAQQQMRWSPRGAHLMLKVRTASVNGTLDRD